MIATSWVGQVASHPLQTDAKIWWRLSGMCVGQVGYGFAQSGFNGPWHVAKLAPRSFRREGCGSQCNPDGLWRGGRRGARDVVGHELHYSSSHLGEPPWNGNAQAIAAADLSYIFEELFE